MLRHFSRAVFVSIFAIAVAQADLPRTYRIALIQPAYTDTPRVYSKLQLLSAATEISDYYSQISNSGFSLDIAVSTVDTGVPKANFFATDDSGNVYATPSNESAVASLAVRAWLQDRIDFSRIDGIVIANSFCGRDYTLGGPITLSGLFVSGTFEVAYDFECPPDPRLAPPGSSRVFWGPCAHEMGHMIEIRSGTALGGNWNGHPSGYASGYALMDSSYPSSPSAYSVLGPELMTGDKRVFNGWLPNHQVVIVDSSVPSVTYPLRALTRTPYTIFCGTACSQQQVIKVPITAGLYYLVEARQRVGIDTLPTTLSPGGVWDEGVHISLIDESGDPPVRIMNSCDSLIVGGCDTGFGDLTVGRLEDPRHKNCLGPQGYTVATLPPYCWPCPLFHVGDTFRDDANNIHISVVGTVADGFSVKIQRGMSGSIPDVRISPRSPLPSIPGFNVSGIPRHQIWVDSSCNGYASDIGPVALRFGDPANSQTLAVGDDLCLGHENRIYTRIQNRGTAAAKGLRVHFDLGDPAAPQGVCPNDFCPSPFHEVGVVDAQRFPALASLAPGAEATVYVPYTAPAQTGASRFMTPSIRVRIDPPQGELSTGDNVADAEFGRVEAVLGNFREAQFRAPDFVYTNVGQTLGAFVTRVGALPSGVAVSTDQTPPRVSLVTGQSLHIPVSFTVSGQSAPAAGRYAANILLAAFVPLSNPMHNDEHPDLKIIAAQTVGIDVVEPSRIDLRAEADDEAQGVIQVQGRLQSVRKNTAVALDYTGRDNKPATLVVRTDDEGEFEARLLTAPGTPVSALWAGDETHAPAAAVPVIPSRDR